MNFRRRQCDRHGLHGNKIAHEGSHWVLLYSDQVVLECLYSSSYRNFCSKVSCFSLPATCHRSHWDTEAALEYLDFLDKNEPLDGAGMISDNDGSAISLQSNGGLEINRTEGESKAKSSDGKSLTTKVTMAMIKCAFVELHVEEEMFTEFRDVDVIEDVGSESVERECPLGEGLLDGEVEHKVEEEALVVETLLTGTQPTWATMMLNHSPRTLWIFENLKHENLIHSERLVPISHDFVNLKGNSTFFELLVLEQVAEASAGSTKESSTEQLIWATVWSTFHSPKLISSVLLESVRITFSAYMGCYLQFWIKNLQPVNKTCQSALLISYPITTTWHRRISEERGSLLRQSPNTKSWSAIIQRTELNKRTSSSKQNFPVSTSKCAFQWTVQLCTAWR